jgi:hypothetical protein
MLCRRAFQKVLAVPTKQLDALWQRYEAFESAGGNPQLAKRLLEQERPKYAAAKAALPQRLAHISPLLTTALALPPGKNF